MDRYPLRFRPILKERVWGGDALATQFGRTQRTDVPIGESWEIVDRPPDTSVVENGPLAGRTLRELCSEHGRRFLGENAPFADRFPLIVKLLDPNDRLSVQVHPSAPYAQRHPEAEGTKSEVWYVLEAEPGARIIHGLSEGATIGELRAALDTGRVEPLLRFVPVEAGSFYYMPSGLIHALLPGSIMIEIQQNCDTTFRLYDWGRVGLDGAPRALHVGEALETAETFLADPSLGAYTELPRERLQRGVERTGGFECPSFRIEKVRFDSGQASVPLDASTFTILTAVAGSCEVRVGSAELSAVLGLGDSALVPAGTEAVEIATAQGATLLLTTLPRPTGTTG
jgi:mannose-6-phosphate isomerase